MVSSVGIVGYIPNIGELTFQEKWTYFRQILPQCIYPADLLDEPRPLVWHANWCAIPWLFVGSCAHKFPSTGLSLSFARCSVWKACFLEIASPSTLVFSGFDPDLFFVGWSFLTMLQQVSTFCQSFANHIPDLQHRRHVYTLWPGNIICLSNILKCHSFHLDSIQTHNFNIRNKLPILFSFEAQ